MSFIHKPTNEPVQREQWRWEAHYSDGSVLKQFDESDNLFHQFAEIDQSRLQVFKMVHDHLPAHILAFPTNGKLVHKYINVVLNARTENEQRVRVYGFGFQLRGFNNFVCIMPDGATIMTDDFNNVKVA